MTTISELSAIVARLERIVAILKAINASQTDAELARLLARLRE